ncbi:MAG: PrsW family intramembrane metalloprotease [Anaerolineae bacterium]|nr:PrsW family intramembrane metalloprotease [Anaerolineae bacterium]
MNRETGNNKPTFSLITRLLVFSIGVGFTLLEVFLLLLLVAGSLFSGFAGQNLATDLYPLINATVMIVLVGCLLLPGLVFSLLEAFRVPHKFPFKRFANRMIFPNLLLVVWMILMGATFLLLRTVPGVQWLLPLLQIPVILIPIFWLYRLATRTMDDSEPIRNWNLLGLNLGLQPILVILLELAALGIVMAAGVAWLATQPDLLESLTHQMEQLAQTNFNMETADRILSPYLEKPLVMYTILFFIAGLVPLLEELIKPILVMRWMKKPLSESQGFLIGLLGGSAFALWENFSALGNITADSWFFVVIARYGTSILHMSTAALLGWALMKSFHDHRYIRAAGAYLVVVALHGAWNFFTMLQAFSTFSVATVRFPMTLTPVAPFAMVALVLIGIAILLQGGRRAVSGIKETSSQPGSAAEQNPRLDESNPSNPPSS